MRETVVVPDSGRRWLAVLPVLIVLAAVGTALQVKGRLDAIPQTSAAYLRWHSALEIATLLTAAGLVVVAVVGARFSLASVRVASYTALAFTAVVIGAIMLGPVLGLFMYIVVNGFVPLLVAAVFGIVSGCLAWDGWRRRDRRRTHGALLMAGGFALALHLSPVIGKLLGLSFTYAMD